MIAVPYVVWLGLGLVLLGLVALVLRRTPEGNLAGAGVCAWGIALVAVGYARWWGNEEGHVFAIAVTAAATLTAAALLAAHARSEEE